MDRIFDVFRAEDREGGWENRVGQVECKTKEEAQEKAEARFECDDAHLLYVVPGLRNQVAGLIEGLKSLRSYIDAPEEGALYNVTGSAWSIFCHLESARTSLESARGIVTDDSRLY